MSVVAEFNQEFGFSFREPLWPEHLVTMADYAELRGRTALAARLLEAAGAARGDARPTVNVAQHNAFPKGRW